MVCRDNQERLRPALAMMQMQMLMLMPMLGSAAGCNDAATGGSSVASNGSQQTTGGSSSKGAQGSSVSSTATGGTTGSSGGTATIAYCEACNPPVSPGKVGSLIDEASGLAASRKHSGRYYVHNDSGDSARFFAIDEKGTDYGRYNVTNAEAVDWEDMAVGPCDQGSCLFLGDIGDNPENRDSYVVYRVAEPANLLAGEHSVEAVALPFRYPDGSHNCETLMVHPTSGQIFVVTKKGSGPSGLYVFPKQTPGQEVVLEKLSELTPSKGDNRFTAGDIHPAGAGILMRTYTSLFFYGLDAQGSARAAVKGSLATTPCTVPASLEIQGETVAWMADGLGWLTVSEGSERPIIRVSCR